MTHDASAQDDTAERQRNPGKHPEKPEAVSSNATLPRTLPGAHTNAEPAAEGEP